MSNMQVSKMDSFQLDDGYKNLLKEQERLISRLNQIDLELIEFESRFPGYDLTPEQEGSIAPSSDEPGA